MGEDVKEKVSFRSRQRALAWFGAMRSQIPRACTTALSGISSGWT